MNLNPPASRFPYDVLKEVILHGHMYTFKPELDDPNILLQLPSPPIVASHVCRWWRYSLLSDTSMWTSLLIPQMKPDGILELLRRSGSAPLDVFLKLKDSRKLEHDNTSHMLFSIFQQIHRFRALYVYVRPLGYGSFHRLNALQLSIRQVLPYLQRPAPELRTFFFSYTNIDLPLEDTFIDTLFSRDAPNLKHILHRLSVDLRELHSPLFHNLSELYLTLHDSMSVDFGLFLDLLASSPRLRLLHVYIHHYDNDVRVSLEHFTGRTVSLPCMQRLVLDVNCTAELMDLILEHVTLPSNLKWRISSQNVSEFANSPALLQRLSQSRFISQHIRLFGDFEGFAEASQQLSLEEGPGPSYINQFNHNKLEFVFEDILDLMDSWDSLMRSIESSRITHLNLELVEWRQSGNHMVISTILTSMTNLETLDIAEDDTVGYRNTCLYCLSVLLPGQNLEPDWSDWMPINTDDTPTITPSFPCPVLREITIKMKFSLKDTQAVVIRKFAEKRRDGGYPLRTFVQCSEIEEPVDSILELQENDIFQVTIVPLTELFG